jgi:hypothetical protein
MTACICYQKIIFNSDAAKITISVQYIVIDKFGKLFFGLPAVNQLRDDLYAGFNRQHKSFLQFTS